MTKTYHTAEDITRQWFYDVVLGLNLCPFAHQPARANTIRFSVCEQTDEQQIMEHVIHEIQLLAQTDSHICETTVVVTPNALGDFYDYQFFLDEANRQLKRHQWQGVFQLASFHPDYCFAGAEADEPSNLTNRSPYPIVHILREASLDLAIEKFTDTDSIPIKNIKTMEDLSQADKKRLFYYLYQ